MIYLVIVLIFLCIIYFLISIKEAFGLINNSLSTCDKGNANINSNCVFDLYNSNLVNNVESGYNIEKCKECLNIVKDFCKKDNKCVSVASRECDSPWDHITANREFGNIPGVQLGCDYINIENPTRSCVRLKSKDVVFKIHKMKFSRNALGSRTAYDINNLKP